MTKRLFHFGHFGGEPRAFSRWFLDQEMRTTGVRGIAMDRALLQLGHAVALLDRGDTRGALDAANACARLDPALRERALTIARMAVRAEIAAMGAAARARSR